MNPVRSLEQTARKILSYPGASTQSSICTYFSNRELKNFTKNDILLVFRGNTKSIQKDKMGYNSEEIGTHSNRSAASIAIFIDNIPCYMIILLGCWSLDSFLKYMRHQVLECSKGISLRMIKNDILYLILDQQANENNQQSQNSNSFATKLSMSPSSPHQINRLVFSLCHQDLLIG